jgi:hypothetical protein
MKSWFEINEKYEEELQPYKEKEEEFHEAQQSKKKGKRRRKSQSKTDL